MNKAKLIRAMYTLSGLPQKDCAKAIEAFMECVGRALQRGEKVQLKGFGVFEVKERKARKLVNRRTEKEITIPSRRVVSFKAGKLLKERINADY